MPLLIVYLMPDCFLIFCQIFSVEHNLLAVGDGVACAAAVRAVGELEVLAEFEQQGLFHYTVNVNIVERQIVHREPFKAGCVHEITDIGCSNITEREMCPVGEERLFVIAGSGTTSDSAVGIAALEENGILPDVTHHDTLAVDILALTAAAWGRLETQTDVCAVKEAVLYHHLLHAAGELRADDEPAVCAINSVVADKEIAVRTAL